MITKGIVEEVINKTRVRVRIPIYNKVGYSATSTPYNDLAVATICSPPGVSPVLTAGDVVFVAFEDGEPGRPVVIGMLFTGEEKFSTSDISCASLIVKNNCVLPQELSSGAVTSSDISCLSSLSGNIQNQIDLLNSKIENSNVTDEKYAEISNRLQIVEQQLLELIEKDS